MIKWKEIDDFGRKAWTNYDGYSPMTAKPFDRDVPMMVIAEDDATGEWLLIKIDGGETLHRGASLQECQRVAETIKDMVGR